MIDIFKPYYVLSKEEMDILVRYGKANFCFEMISSNGLFKIERH